jgi:multidrug transporter EmrE-like cation transporter
MMEEKNKYTNQFAKFAVFTFVLHFLLIVTGFITFSINSNALDVAIYIGLGIATINYLYWGYQFYKQKETMAIYLAIVMALPLFFFINQLIRLLLV